MQKSDDKEYIKKRIHRRWKAMKERCSNKNRKDFCHYGGRGIKVCDEWIHNFQNFYNWAIANGFNPELTLDRIDVNKDYSPDNCRWISQKEQCINTRLNSGITYLGKTQSLADWAKEYGINRTTLEVRIKFQGSPIDKALLSKEEYKKYRATLSNKQPYKLQWGGKEWTIKELSKEYNLDYTTLSVRLKQNNMVVSEEILLQPKKYKEIIKLKREKQLLKNSFINND